MKILKSKFITKSIAQPHGWLPNHEGTCCSFLVQRVIQDGLEGAAGDYFKDCQAGCERLERVDQGSKRGAARADPTQGPRAVRRDIPLQIERGKILAQTGPELVDLAKESQESPLAAGTCARPAIPENPQTRDGPRFSERFAPANAALLDLAKSSVENPTM
jgi:hypothetical protein